MSLSYINLENIKNRPKFWLCKPNKERIATLIDIYDEHLATKENNLSELSFTIPVEIERDHQLVENPLIEKLKGFYLVEILKDNKTEYFVITNDSGKLSSDGVSKSYTLYSYEHKLAKKIVRGQEWTSQNLTKITTDVLSETTWSIGSVPVEFDEKFRRYEVSTSSVLQCIYDLAEKFGAMVEFDTENKLVNYYSTSRGMDRGLRFKDDLFLESFDIQYDFDDIVTRLKVYGEDGLEFRSLSPTGSNYIEDFSWFMYPFECDDNYNVITKSAYMSDELCIALVKYNNLLAEKDGEFKSLVSQRTTTEDSIQQKEQELSVLNTELTTFENELDVINSTYGEDATSRTDYQTCISNINNKKTQITNKNSEITSLENTLTTIDSSVSQLRSILQMENNFTDEELLELDDYILVGEHENASISIEQDLLDEALEVFKIMSSPTISLSLDIVSFLDNIENDVNRKKLILGDTLTFKSEKLNTELKARISEINYDYANDNISITVTNVRESKDLDTKIKNMIYGSASTSASYNMDKFKYDNAVNQANDVSKMLQSEFNANLNGIKGGINSTITFNERGLFAQDIAEPNNMLVIQGGTLSISDDSLQSVKVAINKNGVHAERIIGTLLVGNRLHIEDDNGIININGSTQTVYDDLGNKKIEIGKYTLDSNTKYGINIIDGAINIRTSSTANRGVQFDTNGIRSFNTNGVQTFDVNSATGKVTITGGLEIKTTATSSRGVSFDSTGISGYNSVGTRTFFLDTSGNLTASSVDLSGKITATSGTFTGTINASGGTISGNMTVTGTLNGGRIKGSTIEGASVEGGSIDVDTNVYVGNAIYLGSSSSTTRKLIEFNTWTSIYSDGTTLDIYSDDRISLNADYIDLSGFEVNIGAGSGVPVDINGDVYFTGTVDFSGANVYNLDAETLEGYSASDFVIDEYGGLSIDYSSTSDRIYFRRNGSNLGYIDFESGTVG